MVDFEMIAERVRQTRIKRRISQKQLAEYAGVSKEYISKMECGHQKLNNIELLDRIAGILSVPFEYLLRGVITSSDEYMRDEITELLSSCSPEKKKSIYKLVSIAKRM